MSGNLDVVKNLITEGAYVESRDDKGTTPLHCAAMSGNLDVVKNLITEGAYVESRDDKGTTPLHCAAMSGNLDVVKNLITEGAYVESGDDKGTTPLHCAAMSGSLDVVKYLIAHGANVDSRDEQRTTPLHCAAMSGNLDVVKNLITEGAYVESRDDKGTTPLHCAAMSGNLDVVKNLITEGAYVESRDDKGATPLHYAAKQKGNLDVVKFLAENGANTDAKDHECATPLHNAALVKDNLDVVKYLFEKDADIISVDDGNLPRDTLLHKAAKLGNLEIVQYLLDHDHSANTRDAPWGKTPVYKAARNGHNEVVKLLVEHGAEQHDTMIGTFNRLKDAIEQNMKKSFDCCMALINWFEQEKGWNTTETFAADTPALHHAAAAGSTEMVEAMIKLGVDVNIKSGECESSSSLCSRLQTSFCGSVDDDNKTTVIPLHFAAMKGHLEVVKILVRNGADIHREGYKKRTPLHLACYSGHTETASYLLDRGADPTVLDIFGYNCLHLAIRAHQSEIAALLLGDKRWKEMMKQKTQCNFPCDDAHPELQTPLSNLIVKMPEIAELALSNCVETNEGQMEMYTNAIHPTSKEYEVTYNYDLLEEFSSGFSRKCCSDGGKDTFQRQNHPLFLIMKHNHPNLLKHPLVTSLLKSKWNSFGRKVFFTNLSLYFIFLTFLTAFGLVALGPLESTCERVLSGSFNRTQQDGCEGLSAAEYSFLYFAAITTIILAVLRLALEVLQMTHPVGYLLDWVNWVEIPLYLCSIIFVFVFATPCLCVYHWQWQFGVMAIFLGWIVLIAFLQTWPLTGVYVLMFLHIIRSYLKVTLLALLLITAFGLAFYLQFFEPDEMRNAFSHPGRALVKVMAMTIGELDYDTIFHQEEGEMEIAFPVVSFILWIVFLVSMPLLLNNYLTGLAVGDVNEIQNIAKETEIKLQIGLILSTEELLKTLKIHPWFPAVYDVRMKKRIFVNDPEQLLPKLCAYAPKFIMRRYLKWHISDSFFRTGEEIAEAIKPPPLPLEDLLKQQSEEQAQLLEVKLMKQNEEQGKKLEEKLQKQSKAQSQIIEAKLKEQSVEQSQKLEEKLQKQSEEQSQIIEAKLKEQSVEQSKRLEEKLQKQSEEQRQILEAKLKALGEEQIQQLREQSTEQSEQLQQLAADLDLKLQQKGEEQVRRLEAMMQEQASETEGHIRQLAGEVASMKATVEELLKKLVSK